jgi:hypothetical protein
MLPDSKATSSNAFLRRAIAYFAQFSIRVRRVTTDNGPCFCSLLFAQACRDLSFATFALASTLPAPMARRNVSSRPPSASELTPASRPENKFALPHRKGCSILASFAIVVRRRSAAFRFWLRLMRVNIFNRFLNISYLPVVACFLALAGCGGSGSSSSQPPPPPPEINSVTVTSNSAPVLSGASHLLTASHGERCVQSERNLSVNGVSGGNSSFGTIVGEQYMAPAALPTPSGITITAGR